MTMTAENIDRYLETVEWLRRRYTVGGRLETTREGQYTRYAQLAALAAVKHLHFDLELMPELRMAAAKAERGAS